jgi:hypothetical protein
VAATNALRSAPVTGTVSAANDLREDALRSPKFKPEYVRLRNQLSELVRKRSVEITPNSEALLAADDLLPTLFGHGVEPARLVATAEGGITFYFFGTSQNARGAHPRRASITCLNTGETVVMLSDRTSDVAPKAWEVSDSLSVSQAIHEIRKFVQ